MSHLNLEVSHLGVTGEYTKYLACTDIKMSCNFDMVEFLPLLFLSLVSACCLFGLPFQKIYIELFFFVILSVVSTKM